MVNKEKLKKIASSRLKEAKYLYKVGLYDGAVYLAGYVIEIALKVLICKNLKIDEYPDEGKNKDVFISHDFDRLLIFSGLSKKINAKNRRNKKLFENWSVLTQWRPEGRYSPIGTYKKNNAKDFLKALEDKENGLFVYIKKIW